MAQIYFEKPPSLNYSRISLGGFPPWFWKADTAYFYCKILRVQFLAVFTREKELAASRGGLGKQSTLWESAPASLFQQPQQKLASDRSLGPDLFFPSCERGWQMGGWQRVLRTSRRHLDHFQKQTQGCVVFYTHSAGLPRTFGREEGDGVSLFSSSSPLCSLVMVSRRTEDPTGCVTEWPLFYCKVNERRGPLSEVDRWQHCCCYTALAASDPLWDGGWEGWGRGSLRASAEPFSACAGHSEEQFPEGWPRDRVPCPWLVLLLKRQKLHILLQEWVGWGPLGSTDSLQNS